MSRFMLLARPAPEQASPPMPNRVPRAVAVNEGRGPLAPERAARPKPKASRALREHTALWFWAEPSRPDAP
jgi:hypothetical protein